MISVPFHKLYRSTECQSALAKCDLENIDYKGLVQENLESLGYNKSLLTDSCTRALEIAAHIIGFQKDDEVIIPSYGYVTTASVFHQAGVRIVFADAGSNHPNMSLSEIEPKVSPKTKAIVVINYGGFNNHLKSIAEFCKSRGIVLIEDNAHGIGAKFSEMPLGTFGDFSALSFHHTKNIHAFGGGALFINNEDFSEKADKYYNKGTDKMDFNKGDVPYYQWVSWGNACELSNISAAYLYLQMKLLEQVTEKRRKIWDQYKNHIKSNDILSIVCEVDACEASKPNGHIFPLIFNTSEQKNEAQRNLKNQGIDAYSHYNALHISNYGKHISDGSRLKNAERYTDCLLRLPIYPNLQEEEIEHVANVLNQFIN